MNAAIKVKSITFKDSHETIFEPSKLNVIIGANNSGKSRLLKEIRAKLLGLLDSDNSYEYGAISSVVSSVIDLDRPGNFDCFCELADLDNKVLIDSNGSFVINDYCSLGVSIGPDSVVSIGSNRRVMGPGWKQELRNGYDSTRVQAERDLLRFVGPALVDYCGTEERLVLSAGQKYFGPTDNEENFLSSRYYHDSNLDDLSVLTQEIFDKYVLFDVESRGGAIQLRVGTDQELYEKRTSVEGYRDILRHSTLLKDEGDGFRSFCMVYLALSSKKPVLLIDEPESFLHPAQAFALGQLIAGQINSIDGIQVFIATHSARLLEGILSAPGVNSFTKILRLNRGGNVKESSPIDNELLMSDALFRCSRTYDGLFSKKVLVVEAEADECVYRSLLAKSVPNDDVMLVNVHSKDLIHKAVDFYKKMGIPCGAVVDFDILNDDGTFGTLIKSFGIKEYDSMTETARKLKMIADAAIAESHSCEDEIKNELCSLRDCTKESGAEQIIARIEMLMEEPIKQFDRRHSSRKVWKSDTYQTFKSCKQSLDQLLHQCLKNGLLIVSTGELETVFEPDVPYSSNNKTGWLKTAMDHIQNTETSKLEETKIVQDLLELIRNI